MLPLLVQGAFCKTLFKSNVDANIGITSESQTISGNIDTILKLQEDEWYLLSTEDKIDVLQCVANIEAYYLGLSNELNVGASNLPENTLACYSDTTHTIDIDLERLENDPVDEVVRSCCHEAYHCYQYRLVDAYGEVSEVYQKLRAFRDAALYVDEFNSYVDGNEDFYSYYLQHCEKKAREYAELAVDDYYSKIGEYLDMEGGIRKGIERWSEVGVVDRKRLSWQAEQEKIDVQG